MAEMKFKFTIQPYQTEAVESVIDVFKGQMKDDHFTYRRDAIRDLNWTLPDNDFLIGFANAQIQLDSGQLLENIRKIQARNNIKLSKNLGKGHLGDCSLDVEMETGTGKTYVYIKTMFELNRQYGWSKFIVVVPSIAIREGVRKSFETMESHFMEHYGKKARYFVYDSRNLAEIDHFSQSAEINVMIINIQAFNARGKDARRIRTELDHFGSRRPIDVIQANRPILILDEPQKMGGAATQDSLKDFNPLFCLNYSATHKQHHELVYVLDALDAYRKRLVKRIEVKGFDVRNLRGTNRYLFLEEIAISPKKPPMARIEFEIKHDKAIKREVKIVKVDDDLFSLSKNMEQYRGYRINDIDPIRRTVSFTNGEAIHVGEVVGDIAAADVRRVQIRETIRSHFEKEQELFSKGIKTLSLFFIDEVAKYRQYDDDGNEINSEYGDIFEQEYTRILNEYLTRPTPYEQYLRGIDTHQTHAGYFSIDKRGRKVDSSTKRGSDESDDISAYDLILKDKELLLSFRNPVRFIFSHSALREGWDNPNVFQICTLKHGGSSPTQKRQEVGRGLRLCVNQMGERMDVETLGSQLHQINQLTVIASDGYQEFVADLQKGIREDLYERPTQATKEYFIGKTLLINGKSVTITKDQGNDIYRYLIKNDYIDNNDCVTDKYRADLANETLAPVPESCTEIAEGVHALVCNVFDEHALDGMILDGRETKIQENALNDNFYKKEFQTLWNYINHRYTYTVEFDSEELIRNSIRHIDKELSVSKLQYTVTTGEQSRDLNSDQLQRGTGFAEEKSQTFTLERSGRSLVKYDLVGKIAEGSQLTRRSAAKILSGIALSTFEMFKCNPEEFITKVIRIIIEQKASMIVEHITYNQAEGRYDSSIFTADKNTDFSRAYQAKKHVQDYVFVDGYAQSGQSVEYRFAKDMDHAEEVYVYAKLPRGFSIPTPMGNYSPDWAIAFHDGTVKHVFFVAETKGSMETFDLRGIEKAKIECARKLFKELLFTKGVVYDVADSYKALLDKVVTLRRNPMQVPDNQNDQIDV